MAQLPSVSFSPPATSVALCALLGALYEFNAPNNAINPTAILLRLLMADPF
jgi:hypothetical protein